MGTLILPRLHVWYTLFGTGMLETLALKMFFLDRIWIMKYMIAKIVALLVCTQLIIHIIFSCFLKVEL